jgi:hypothetical protein
MARLKKKKGVPRGNFGKFSVFCRVRESSMATVEDITKAKRALTKAGEDGRISVC